jgi:hypothetical protein
MQGGGMQVARILLPIKGAIKELSPFIFDFA